MVDRMGGGGCVRLGWTLWCIYKFSSVQLALIMAAVLVRQQWDHAEH